MKAALKAGDKQRLGVIRMLLAELKNANIAAGEEIDDTEQQKLLASYAKKRKEAMEGAQKVGREDIATKEQFEFDVTMSYMPAQLPEAELREIVRKHAAVAGEGKAAFGAVMKAVMEEVGGQADGKTVSALVREMMP